MIREINNKKDLKRFIYYVKDLYKDNPHYIYPLFSILFKELRKEVIEEKNYTAILSLNEKDEIYGRLLYRIEFNEKEKRNVCYFSYFDLINSESVARELLEYMEVKMQEKGVNHSEGSFTPYDPDNRRGILINNFDCDPMIFTSYNMDYIPSLLENYGYTKTRDTFSMEPQINEKNRKKLDSLGRFFERRHDVRVDYLDFKHLDKEIEDIHTILKEADNEHIYQETPSIELIRSVASNLKFFLDKRIIRIARENETNRPIGFCFCLHDFNQVFKILKGKVRPLRMLLLKKKITKARGMMQYVVPDYQGNGLIGYIFMKIFAEFENIGITEFEAGTMMEDNTKPMSVFEKLGGAVSKTYRIYGKDIL